MIKSLKRFYPVIVNELKKLKNWKKKLMEINCSKKQWANNEQSKLAQKIRRL